MNLIDLLIIALAVVYGLGGYRNGAIVGFFSLAGFLLGASIGAQLARPIGRALVGGQAQVPIAITVVLVSALLLQLAAVWVAGRLRSRIRWHFARRVDHWSGAVFGVVAVLIVSWMLALVVQSSPYPSLDSAVRRSAVVGAVDRVMPSGLRNLYHSLQTFMDRSGFPNVLNDLQATRIVNVPAPDAALASSAGVNLARPSVFKIYGQAPSCSRQIEGSGFVYAPQHILTNAHVVAGTSQVSVVMSDGSQVRAHVVLYDPERDVAVLYVPGLNAQPLSFAGSPAGTGANSVVLGYPEDQGFDVRAARIRDREFIQGPDIYGNNQVKREIYSIRGLVRSGNSGGPLITPNGTVLGIVFATAVDSTDTGFVLTDSEVSPDAAQGAAVTASVGTQGCTPGG